MIILNLFYLLFASALTTRKETTVYYSRIVILSLLASVYICYNNLYVIALDKGIGIYGGIFNVTTISQSFNIFILLISAIILSYNSFYHRTLIKDSNSSLSIFSISGIKDRLTRKDNYNMLNLGDNKSGLYRIIEYPLIILFIITGAVFLMSSGDLISIFISIELQSYGLYILSTLHRDSEQSTWGGLTYFLLGGLSSCFILLGSGLLYINSGTTSLDGIYILSTISDIMPDINTAQTLTISSPESLYELNSRYNINLNVVDTSYINTSLIIISVGFLFKVSAAPFHFWSPEVYDAIPTAVTTYVAIIAKISIFIFLLELVYYMGVDVKTISGVMDNKVYFSWKDCLLFSSLFSLIIGSVLGITQFRIKRVYAYSTISHVGFILLALCVNNTESIQAYLFYIITYTVSNLNAFIILVTIGYTMYLYLAKEEHLSRGAALKTNISDETNISNINETNYSIPIYENEDSSKLYDDIKKVKNINFDLENNNIMSYTKTFNSLIKSLDLKDINNSPIQLVSQLKGYFYINSYLSLSLAITLFSFIGIPPLIGFFAKQMVLSAALDNGYIFITLIAILTSVIGAVYYLNIVKQMFFYNTDYVINPFIYTYNYFGTLTSNKNRPTTVFNGSDIRINSPLSSIISILTLILLLFIFIPNESFTLTRILTVILFN